MLNEALTALAAAGGAGVVQAASTDAWVTLRQQIARLLGRGDSERERVELERLDRTASVLGSAAASEIELLRVRQEASWQARFEALLESLDDREQEAAAASLQLALQQLDGMGSQASQSWTGNIDMHADASGSSKVYQVGQGNLNISGS
ncbi:hypothetical protein ACFWJS_41215 [Streptomyces sp. NPDC127061]|uniref:hypothetical protein n=1 Tax=unclassified Streptomyces TaxID=2593676 RepID=UPI0021C871C6|nr:MULTISPECIES: hypothetical protein [unclassified Streptomyces]MCR8576067.1 hypothetical protein [Streptomyces sp. Isolate_219]MCX5159737.1 hypothetical protein [Streptomyces sp. NBC_00305]MCX5218260.1 hypothetical protein [Streptomyces sp. NBC_00264]